MKTWDLQDWWDVSDTCQSFIKQAIKHGWTKDKIENSVSELSKDQKQILTEVILSRSDELREHLRSKTTQISNASLQDFDWQMKLAMSSDKLATVQEPLLVVDLNIRESEKKKAVSLEMNKLELEKMITSFEAANKVVQQLKS
ncbi:COMM domain-containing protein 8-like isoform X2 [Liolophura sinensis]